MSIDPPRIPTPHIRTPHVPTPHIPTPRIPTEPPEGFWEKLKQPRVWIPIAVFVAFLLLAGIAWILWNWRIALIVAICGPIAILIGWVLVYLFSDERQRRLGRGIYDRSGVQSYDEAPGSYVTGDIDGSFRRALSELRESRIDDVYELPWYLVLGEPGGGKTEMVRHSGLDVPAEYAHTRKSGPTRDCDFWLTNQAVILDASGRYAESEDPAALREWKRLLTLLKRHRSKFPIDGIVVALPIAHLLARSAEQVAAGAHLLRRRFNELQDTLGVDVPIYIAVTQCDRLQGFLEFAGAVPTNSCHEALGWTNQRRRFADAGEAALKGLAGVQQRIETLIPEMLLREANPVRRRRMYLFPSEFEEASRALAEFLRSAFAPSVYDHEVPFLRGVYFTSSQRAGTTLSPVLQRLGHDWAQTEVDANQPLEAGLFLRGLFRDIIVGDRDLAVRRRWRGKRVRRSIVWPAAGASLLCGMLLGISAVQNFQAERAIQQASHSVIDRPSDLLAIDELRRELSRDIAQHIPFEGFWLAGNLGLARERGRDTFVWAFEKEFEKATKEFLLTKVGAYEADSFEALATATLDVAYLGRDASLAERIRTGFDPDPVEDPEPERAAASDADAEPAVEPPTAMAAVPDLVPYAGDTRLGSSEADEERFRRNYEAFVGWLPDSQRQVRIDREREAVLIAAPKLLRISELERWATHSRSAPDTVRYRNFGIADYQDSAATEVSGAYTKLAWESLVRILVAGVENVGAADSGHIATFRAEYVERYDQKWRNLLMQTPEVPMPLERAKDSPVLPLLDSIHTNTAADLPRRSGKSIPPWIVMLREVKRTEPLEIPGENAAAEEAPPWGRYQAQLDLVEAEAVEALRGGRALEFSRRMIDPNATFRRALTVVRSIAVSREDELAEAKLRDLLSAPILDSATAMLELAIVELDDAWKKKIVEPYATRLDSAGFERLYAKGGALDQFIESDLSPFYADGGSVALVGDRSLPLGRGFLNWVASAKKLQGDAFRDLGASRITVRLEGVPTNVRSGPAVNVSKTVLNLDCEAGAERFEYRQGVGSHDFPWTTHCGRVGLQAYAGAQQLGDKKEWTSFPRFLQDGYAGGGGDTLLWVVDFGNTTLEVRYRLVQGREILKYANPEKPPLSLRD